MASPQVELLAARIGEPIETEEDMALAEASLSAAWDWVRLYGKPEWSPDEYGTPGIAQTIALSAASRAYQNPAGYTMERADSVTFNRHDTFAQGAELTRAEISALKLAAGSRATVTSVAMTNPETFVSRRDVSKDYDKVTWFAHQNPHFKPLPLIGWSGEVW